MFRIRYSLHTLLIAFAVVALIVKLWLGPWEYRSSHCEPGIAIYQELNLWPARSVSHGTSFNINWYGCTLEQYVFGKLVGNVYHIDANGVVYRYPARLAIEPLPNAQIDNDEISINNSFQEIKVAYPDQVQIVTAEESGHPLLIDAVQTIKSKTYRQFFWEQLGQSPNPSSQLNSWWPCW
jgi:hypothetical protein